MVNYEKSTANKIKNKGKKESTTPVYNENEENGKVQGNVNRCHFNRMCWEQPLNLLSIAFADYIVHYFHCVFSFLFLSLPLAFSFHCSSISLDCDGFSYFLICCCVPSHVFHIAAVNNSRVCFWPRNKSNKKNYYPYCIIENHVEFDNFQLSAHTIDCFSHFLVCVCVCIYTYIFSRCSGVSTAFIFLLALQFQIGNWLSCGFTIGCLLFDFCRRVYIFFLFLHTRCIRTSSIRLSNKPFSPHNFEQFGTTFTGMENGITFF